MSFEDPTEWVITDIIAGELQTRVHVHRHVSGFNPENCAIDVHPKTLRILSCGTMHSLEAKRVVGMLEGQIRLKVAEKLSPETRARIAAWEIMKS